MTRARPSPAQRLSTAVAVCLLGVGSAASVARAQDGTAGRVAVGRIAVEVTACGDTLVQGVRHTLEVEVGDLLISADDAATPSSDRLTIRCAGNLAWLEASGTDGANAIECTLPLADFPGDAAPRALALAGLELLAARSPAVRARLEAKPSAAPPPTVAPVVASPAFGVTPRSMPPRYEWRFGLAGTWRTFLVGQGISAWGGQAVVSRDAGRWWQVHADAELAGSRRQVSLGEASALLVSCSTGVAARVGVRDLGVVIGVGARLGFARLSGSAYDRATVTGSAAVRPWGGPLASVGAHVGVGPVALLLGVEAGRTLGTVKGLAADAPVLLIQDTWIAVALGAALRR